MNVFSSLGTLVVLALLAASCNLLGVDSIICGKPPQIACVTGTVLGETCPAGTIIQLHHSVGGETITYGFGERTSAPIPMSSRPSMTWVNLAPPVLSCRFLIG
ncbi:hypothetical protein [Hymenobacter jeollabukensis]|uniref:Uncharacterized protein n=1 Tax=Hymenobacter jeollabukensis TaxID=2025313 RepID=A0A5R8WJ39_9BACT|nr:hypothetical protein [Hymenobacter jeollabukensis]TLM88907.1 hypothetical protein FDY95_22250 [Hymenobacter jeollabukensis]